jgi:IclR family transcriptional regulator, KDG regulon repressor
VKSGQAQVRAKRQRAVAGKRGDKSFLAVADKLFRTLETFTSVRENDLTLEEVTRRTGLPKSTSFRLLSSLEKCGYLTQNKLSGRYSLGDRFFELANSSLPYQRLISIARPYLNSLMLTFAESVNLGVYDDGMVAHIFTIDSPKPYRVSATVGNRAYLHCTGMGKALAAYMDEAELRSVFMRYGLPSHTQNTLTTEQAIFEEMARIRKTGICHDNQEDVEGVECFASAIFGTDDKPVASMSVSGPSVRMRPQAESISAAVRDTARRISYALGWTQPSDSGK